jgi:hypothetical protein
MTFNKLPLPRLNSQSCIKAVKSVALKVVQSTLLIISTQNKYMSMECGLSN